MSFKFETKSGSLYEVDSDNKLIRRLIGTEDPTPRQGKDGEWKSFIELILVKGESAVIMWDPAQVSPINNLYIGTNPCTVTSVVVDILTTSD